MAQQLPEEQEKQIVRLNQKCEIECVCGDAQIVIKSTKCKGPNMYFCKGCEGNKKDAGNKYCAECGPFMHRKNKKGHAFDINSTDVVLINNVLATKENGDKAHWGKKLLVAMIGVERYNQVVPYIEKVPAVGAAGMGGLFLYTELVEFMADKGTKVFATKNVINSGGVVMVVASLAEMAVNGYRWGSGQISGKEWLRLTGKTIARNAAAFGGMAGGAKLGAAVGTAFTPGLGTAVGVVAGAILGFLCGKAAALLYENFFPDGEEAARRDAVKEAIKYFHYQRKDIKNKKIFNKKELRRRFKKFALDAHPDRRDGDHTEWNVLSQHYGILKGLCEENKETKKMVTKVLAIEHK